MPIAGGTADKLGNYYEGLWIIDQFIRLIEGEAKSLVLESIEASESQGVEFKVLTTTSAIEYWSIKRQAPRSAGWTLAALTEKQPSGRSILGDLLLHTERAQNCRAVFCSTSWAAHLGELRQYAQDQRTLEARLQNSMELDQEFRSRLLPLCGNNWVRAVTFLQRTKLHIEGEDLLRERVDYAIRKSLYRPSGDNLDPSTIRGLLSEFAISHLHQEIDRLQLLEGLKQHGVYWREWSQDRQILDRVSEICRSYVDPIESHLIGGVLLDLLPNAGALISADGKPVRRRTLLVGNAGSGKSCVLAGAVKQFVQRGIPVLSIRFDQALDGILTTAELGRKLNLPDSPAVVLAGMANGGPCVLIIDQLDAISIASGRRAEAWGLFEALLREADRLPGLCVVAACRGFDLENDHRLRSLQLDESKFSKIVLRALDPGQVDQALRGAKVDPQGISASLKTLLGLPLHLAMFLAIPPLGRTAIQNREELFDRFWTDKEQMTDRRLGRKSSWIQVIDKLAAWLSDHQELFAPRQILDEFAADASGMISENVLVSDSNNVRFFHESFFDYAFARRFGVSGKSLVSFLSGSEQHLFRRAQVRQILCFLRASNWRTYLTELGALLRHQGVRFHLKGLVLRWLSSIASPTSEEWEILRELSEADPSLRPHVLSAVAESPDWFGVLDATGYLLSSLYSEEVTKLQEAIWLCSASRVMQTHSPRIAELLLQCKKPTEQWKQCLRYVCRFGNVHHSRKFFDLFLALIDDGTLDGVTPGVAVNDDWFGMLYTTAKERPEYACEAIGHWFDRIVRLSSEAAGNVDDGDKFTALREDLDEFGHGPYVLMEAAKKAPAEFAKNLFPRLAAVIEKAAKAVPDRLDLDPIWSFRSFGDDPHSVSRALMIGVATSLELLAKESPAELDRLLQKDLAKPHDSIAYLVLRAWTSSPQTYARKIADYLLVNPRRLLVGYATWGSSGASARYHVSGRAIEAVCAHVPSELVQALEKSVLNLSVAWERREPKHLGRAQLELLRYFDKGKLSQEGSSRLEELKTRFPFDEPAQPVKSEIVSVGSPIPEKAFDKMSDGQWTRALQKYAGVDRSTRFLTPQSGGELELASRLQRAAKANPGRFTALAEKLPDDLPSSYFNAILRGLADRASEGADGVSVVDLGQAANLIRRVHSLPGRPCGKAIAWLIQKLAKAEWPVDIFEALSWYAMNDPDPRSEEWQSNSPSGELYYRGDPYSAGLNSARGTCALTIAQILFKHPESFPVFEAAIERLIKDPSTAVHSCAVDVLLAVLNVEEQKAVAWFCDLMRLDPVALAAPHANSFFQIAGICHYARLRHFLQSMLSGQNEDLVRTAARVICLLSLDVDDAAVDSGAVRAGNDMMREAAAEVYAVNVADQEKGSHCRALVKQFFADPAENVRVRAGSAFRQIAKLQPAAQADLISAFLSVPHSAASLEPIIRALEDSPVELPSLVCDLAEKCIQAFTDTASDLRTHGATVALDISKIVIRLYAQTRDGQIQRRCLDLIDLMERNRFWGLKNELEPLDRN